MELAELCERYDTRLRVGEWSDLDASANGLQVGPPAAEVEHVAFAVDAAVATAEAAREAGADALVVHHGLSWGGIERVTGQAYERIAPLVEGDLALYAAHLPLDGHQELGNAAGVADLLGLEDREPFGEHGPEHVGQRGRLPAPESADAVADLLAADLDTGDGRVRALDFGPDDLSEVAIVTGSGADYLQEARAAGVDCLVTGEGKQKLYHEAREAGVTAVLAGHYATETFGVRSLQSLAEVWGLETTFLDHPTGL
ncbi:MAG: Nif3-like dinuclear metal center hexameric protein [Halobacteriaceae archaeon]